MYYFIELAGSITNIALLSLFMSRLFVRNKIQSKWHYTFLTLLCTGQCVLSLFPNWVIPRTLYLLLGGFLLARLFYEVQTWPAAFASGSFFVLGSVVEILAMLLIGVRLPDTDLLMQVGAARLIYVVFSNLIQIPLLILVSHFFNREESDLRIVWLLPLISIQLASISVCYVVQCHAADKDFPDYMVFFMAVLLFVNIMIVFYVEALRKNEKEKYLAELTEQHYHLQIEYYQQLLEKQQETKALWHDIKKYTTAMQAVAAQNDSEQLRQIAQAAADAYERVKDISAVGNPVVDALLNQYLRSAKENQIQVLLDITIPEVLAISTLLLSVVIGNTFDNAIEACRLIAPEKRVIHLQLRKQNRILFYSIENPYIDAVTQLRVGKHHGYGLKNVERAVNQNKAEKDLLALKTEILAVIKGESAFPKDTLAEMIAAQEKKHTELDTLCEEASAELERNAELMANVSRLYDELISYADLYDSANFEAKKMIVNQLIRRVDVYRGYQINISFNFDLTPYIEGE